MAANRPFVVLFALLAGCAGLPRAEITQATAGAAREAADVPVTAVTEAVEVVPVIVPPPVKEAVIAKSVAAPAKPAVNEATHAQAVAPRKAEEPAAAAKPREPAFDMTALKVRLRDTAAIGVMAKLSLRKQMDELLDSFREHYEGGQKTSIAALRKPYDALVMKVLDLLQEGDPSLSRSIANSREAIWGVLADRERFGLLK